MKLAVSNIAWPREQDDAVAAVLRKRGVTGIEIAPTKLWSNPLAASAAEVAACRRWWEQRGLRIVAAQALLFGRPDLTVFDSIDIRIQTSYYLRRIIARCAELGASALVFGSPKNRRIGSLPKAQAWPTAVEFFDSLATEAELFGAAVVLEANPPEYGADFVTRASEAVEFVRAVNRPGLRLHLDAACMTLANDPIRATFDDGFADLSHFHVSEPNLELPGGSDRVEHAAFAAELRQRGYSHWVSLEMRELQPFHLNRFADAVQWFRDTYGRGEE